MRIIVPIYSEQRRADFFREALSRIESLPGVQRAAAALTLPFGGRFPTKRGFRIDRESGRREDSANYQAVTAQYFGAMSIPLKAGRVFTDLDTADTRKVAVVNEAFRRRIWEEATQAVGLQIWVSRDDQDTQYYPYEIVGVVGDVRTDPVESVPEPEIYVPHAQDPWPALTLVVRSGIAPSSLTSAIRREVEAVNKNYPIYDVRPMDQILYASVASRRLQMLTLVGFSLLALVIGAVGVAGMMTYRVRSIQREMAVRVALGATPTKLFRRLMMRTFVMIVVALVGGSLVSVTVGRSVAHLLFEVRSIDLEVFATAWIVLSATTLLAAYLPARAVLNVEPQRLLKIQ